MKPASSARPISPERIQPSAVFVARGGLRPVEVPAHGLGRAKPDLAPLAGLDILERHGIDDAGLDARQGQPAGGKPLGVGGVPVRLGGEQGGHTG